jgi:hypothetical protein
LKASVNHTDLASLFWGRDPRVTAGIFAEAGDFPALRVTRTGVFDGQGEKEC